MTKRYLGNIITQNPTAPAGNFQASAAKGVWSLEEQLAYQKAGLWPVPGNTPPDITDVFSTYVYEGTNDDGPDPAQTITNGIDLAGEGGMVWTKARDYSANHAIVDTVRGNTKYLESSTTSAEKTTSVGITSFNSNGYSLGADNTWQFNTDNAYVSEYASWTFRKAPKFFTCLTYTGDSNATQTVNHDLGSVPGMIIIKKTDGTSNWTVYHRSAGSYRLRLNTTEAQDENGFWATSPTDTAFTLSNSDVKSDGATYVAYLFAHNDGDGGFGPDGSDIIKCGSYTGNGSTPNGPIVDLGFEPQWLLIKNASATANWYIYDAMRGWPVDSSVTTLLRPDTSEAELGGAWAANNITPTGFQVRDDDAHFNTNGSTYIYMAIRRGPLASPTAGTEVFAIDNQTASSAPFLTSNFPVDMVIRKRTTGGNSEVMSRLTQGKGLFANATSTEQTDSVAQFDFNDGCLDNTSTDTNRYGWMWKRAPGYFDAVAYTGNSTAGRTVSHNLTVAPEMMWVKNRNGASGGARPWIVYHKDTGNTGYLKLNEAVALITSDPESKFGNGTAGVSPTDSNFTVAGDYEVNYSGDTYIAYLFATLPGISKVGSYTGTGNSGGDINVDCGFTSGARFVLIKRTDASGGWWVADTVRGIVTGNEPLLALNDTGAEVTGFNMVKPYSAGFIVNGSGGGDNAWNDAGGTYIFYAIA